MRVRDSGSGFLGFGGGDKGRSDAFKKGRRPGQKVRGTLVKQVTEDTAWVTIEGHKLLAQLHARAPEGAQLTFVIQQLTPSIVLKAIFEPSQSGTSALNLAKGFDTARTLFENKFRRYSERLTKTRSDTRKTVFIELLSDDKQLMASYFDAVNCLGTINSTLESNTINQFSYKPWIVPTARRHICLTRVTDGLVESIIEFDLANIGMVRAEFLTKGDDIGYKLKLQHKGKGAHLKRYLTTRDRSSLLANIQCLEVSKLPQSCHGGILTEFLFKQ